MQHLSRSLVLLCLGVAALDAGCGGGDQASADAAAAAPTITAQPTDQAVAEGAPATFEVTATGDAPLTYQWQKNGAAIADAIGPSYTTPAAAVGDDGAQFTVMVSNAVGSVTSAPATLSVKAGTWFGYVANAKDNTVSAFAIAHDTGLLVPLSAPTFTTDASPTAIVARGDLMYIACEGKIDAFHVDPASGAVTPVAGSPFTVPNLVNTGLALSPDGGYLYAATSSSLLSFTVGADGGLTMAGNVAISTALFRIAAAGPFVFATDNSRVFTFRVNAGTLTAPATSTKSNVWEFLPTPDGLHAFAIDYGGHVTAYAINGTTGVMTAGTSYTAEAGASTRAGVTSSDGTYLYAVNRSGDITTFAVASDATLSPEPGTITLSGLDLTFEHIALSPDGRFIYLSATDAAPNNVVIAFAVASDGTVTSVRDGADPAQFLIGNGGGQGLVIVQ